MSQEQFGHQGSLGNARYSLFGSNSNGSSNLNLGVNTNLSRNVSVGAGAAVSSAGVSHPSANVAYQAGPAQVSASVTHTPYGPNYGASVGVPTGANTALQFQGSTGAYGHSGSIGITHRF